jgi:membrane fusion protein (multidrug efflux system)
MEQALESPSASPTPPATPHRGLGARLREGVHRRRRALTFGLVVLLVALGALVWWYLSTYQSTDDAQIDAHISAVSTRVAGTVTRVLVEDNQYVHRGDLLVELDPRDYQVAQARAEADLAQARAALEAEQPQEPITATTNLTDQVSASDEVSNARAALAAAERDYDAALARTHQAEANRVRSAADRRRYQYLLHERAITQERFDQVLATAQAQDAEVAASEALARAARHTVEQQNARLWQAQMRRAQLTHNAPRQLAIRGANSQSRQASVQAAQAGVERARLDLEYTRIVAPIDGIVGKRAAEPGNHVLPGEQLIAIVDLEHVWVTANFKETQLRWMRVGQPARVHVDALKRNLAGRIESFAGASGARFSLLPPENATGNFVKVVQRLPVRIALRPGQDRQHRLRPGMSVEPRVRLR